MKNMMRHKGYYGSVNFDAAFKEAVDDYIESCTLRNTEPEKPFKGSLNIRIGRELHEKAALIAKEAWCSSLNEFIKQALDHEIKRFA